jgi:DNA-binding transcriptional LysR family regulator
LHVTLCESNKVAKLLMNGEIDFGFVTSPLRHADIVSREFVREEYVLVSDNESQMKNLSLQELRRCNFIRYPGMDILFNSWRSTYFGKSQKLQLSDFTISGEMNSLNGAITLASYGVGLAVFPRHCIENQLRKKELFAYQDSGSRRAENPIYIIQLANKYQTARVQQVLNVFWSMKKT